MENLDRQSLLALIPVCVRLSWSDITVLFWSANRKHTHRITSIVQDSGGWKTMLAKVLLCIFWPSDIADDLIWSINQKRNYSWGLSAVCVSLARNVHVHFRLADFALKYHLCCDTAGFSPPPPPLPMLFICFKKKSRSKMFCPAGKSVCDL